jgi:hypothetical protein
MAPDESRETRCGHTPANPRRHVRSAERLAQVKQSFGAGNRLVLKTVVLPARYNFLYFIKARARRGPPPAFAPAGRARRLRV